MRSKYKRRLKEQLLYDTLSLIMSEQEKLGETSESYKSRRGKRRRSSRGFIKSCIFLLLIPILISSMIIPAIPEATGYVQYTSSSMIVVIS